MSDIPRYKPVSNDRLGIADDADGKLCEYRDYEKLKSTVQSFAKEVLRLGNECRDLAISNAVLRQENEELHRDYEALADEHTKLTERHKTLKAEVERLRYLEGVASSVDFYQQENARLKAEVERLRKHGDAMAETLEGAGFDSAMDFWNAAKEGKQP